MFKSNFNHDLVASTEQLFLISQDNCMIFIIVKKSIGAGNGKSLIMKAQNRI